MFRVEFENSKGERRTIAKAPNMQEANKVIYWFLKDNDFTSYYFRYCEMEDGDIAVDVGSHTEFFWISEE